jgi:tripartite-type tricarboxylate transporter receptor subunit TctC
MKSTLIGLLAATLLCGPVLAEEYPAKPVRILVPFAVGGTVDIAACHIGQVLFKKWDQPVVVESKPGCYFRDWALEYFCRERTRRP